jgi:rRNA-processing protein FCF1
LEIHIKGTENHFADILSRSTKTDSHISKKSNECLVAKTNIYLDQALKRELSKLTEHQGKDQNLCKISDKLAKNPYKFRGKYMMQEKILYCKDKNKYQYWRVMLPKSLEIPIIN